MNRPKQIPPSQTPPKPTTHLPQTLIISCLPQTNSSAWKAYLANCHLADDAAARLKTPRSSWPAAATLPQQHALASPAETSRRLAAIPLSLQQQPRKSRREREPSWKAETHSAHHTPSHVPRRWCRGGEGGMGFARGAGDMQTSRGPRRALCRPRARKRERRVAGWLRLCGRRFLMIFFLVGM